MAGGLQRHVANFNVHSFHHGLMDLLPLPPECALQNIEGIASIRSIERNFKCTELSGALSQIDNCIGNPARNRSDGTVTAFLLDCRCSEGFPKDKHCVPLPHVPSLHSCGTE